MLERSTIRKQIRAQRRALSAQQRLIYSEQFAFQFSRTKAYQKSKKIACYFANDGEIDLLPLITLAWGDNKEVYLPVLEAAFNSRLQFARYTANTALVVNRFNIPEPALAARKRVRPLSLDLVLTPLVAFDLKGNRIGMGGGFYDRTFAYLRQRQFWHRPKLIGCAYDFQQVDEIKSEDWDVPLSCIATNNGLLRV